MRADCHCARRNVGTSGQAASCPSVEQQGSHHLLNQVTKLPEEAAASALYFSFNTFPFDFKVFIILLSESIRIHFTPRFLKEEKRGDTLTAFDLDWETVISILTRMQLFLAEPRLSEASRALISVPRSRLLLTWETDTFLNASNWPEEVTRRRPFLQSQIFSKTGAWLRSCSAPVKAASNCLCNTGKLTKGNNLGQWIGSMGCFLFILKF